MEKIKRSFVDEQIRLALEALGRSQVLPKWARWTPKMWQEAVRRGMDPSEIINCGLGWDFTTFGVSERMFPKTGLVAFTLSNGNPDKEYPQEYCQKLLWLQEGQSIPWHHHKDKREDIYHIAGGRLRMQVARPKRIREKFEADKTENLILSLENAPREFVPCGEFWVGKECPRRIRLEPGIGHLMTGGCGGTLLGEVSSVNKEVGVRVQDNTFWAGNPRYINIVADVPPRYVLCNEYAELLKVA
ncbi:MAG: D-lyxose/D-mannose family sugar isomerase [bacterium]|nr:D-lyxose/D-mannose family sugar isomerase [bacterium]